MKLVVGTAIASVAGFFLVKILVDGPGGPDTPCPDDFRWSVYIEDEPPCGGSIIAEDWVITSAHCVENLQPVSEIASKDLDGAGMLMQGSSVFLIVGTHDLEEGGERIKITERPIVHGKYSGLSPDPFDVALIHLTKKLPPKAAVISLAVDPEVSDGTAAFLSGWVCPADLECEEGLRYVPVVTGNKNCHPDMICGGDTRDLDKDGRPDSGAALFGDSGNGLTIGKSDSATLIGIVATAGEGDHDTYVNVAYRHDFIKRVQCLQKKRADPGVKCDEELKSADVNEPTPQT